MADETSDGSLDNNTTDQPDPTNEIIPVEETESITPIQQTENMEVHKHPHHVTHKKKWTEYLLEFFMLFLAVFLGFVAENVRENRVNLEIEKRNIESFINNLKKDSMNLTKVILNCRSTLDDIDSLTQIPGEFSDTAFQKDFFHFVVRLIYRDLFVPDESSFQQMQSSGSLRLIKHANVTDTILKYHTGNQYIKEEGEYIDTWFKLSGQHLSRLADFRNAIKHKPLKLIGGDTDIQGYINYKIAQRVATTNYLSLLTYQLLSIKTFIPFLQKEYHLENE
jgi:hypothetical protein